MFNGIVETRGRIVRVAATAAGKRLAIAARAYWNGLNDGASVAVDGVCLTMISARDDSAEFDVIGETLQRSTLGRAAVGREVNLERSLRADGRIEGHFVQGHVDGIGEVTRVERGPQSAKWWFKAPSELRACLIPKGSIAIDGISLTIVDVDQECFSVALIPTTLERTTLGDKGPGDAVNLESDILVRTVLRVLTSMQGAPVSSVTMQRLIEEGFSR